MSRSIVTEQRGAVLIATMDRIEKRNAIDDEMKEALFDVGTQYCADPALRCLVITGTKKIFCAGGDILGMSAARSPGAVRARMAKTHAAAKLLFSCEKPVICAVNGAAVGAGISLALLGDIVVAADDAFFLSGFPRIGVLPDMGLIYHLPKAVGLPRAKDILLTNRRIAAAEALAMGLVSRVFPSADFESAVAELATQISEGPSIALGLTKAMINRSHGDEFEDFLAKESLAQVVAFEAEDFLEGNAAFREKREPTFRGT